MKCPKCHGTVVREWVPEALEEEYQLRCLNCGWVAPIEVQNKRHSPDLDSLLADCCCHIRKNRMIDAR